MVSSWADKAQEVQRQKKKRRKSLPTHLVNIHQSSSSHPPKPSSTPLSHQMYYSEVAFSLLNTINKWWQIVTVFVCWINDRNKVEYLAGIWVGFLFSHLSSLGSAFVSPAGCEASFVTVRWTASRSELDCVSISHLQQHARGETNTPQQFIWPLSLRCPVWDNAQGKQQCSLWARCEVLEVDSFWSEAYLVHLIA